VSSSALRNGYFYPLDVEQALDGHAGPAYIQRAAYRALREPQSARNMQRRRAITSAERAALKSSAMPP